MATPEQIINGMVGDARRLPARTSRRLRIGVESLVAERKLDQPTAYNIARELKRLGYDSGGTFVGKQLEEVRNNEKLQPLIRKIVTVICVNVMRDFRDD